MPALVHIGERVVRERVAFADRADAGRALASVVATVPDPGALVLALPRGGVPVAAAVSEALGCDLLPAFVRKLPIPASPEMGFGAVTLDGTVTLNQDVVRLFGLTPADVASVTEDVRREVERRARSFGETGLPEVEGRRVLLVDDGLATGYTAIAAADMVRARGAGHLTVAVPVAPASAVVAVARHCDELFCLIAQESASFAVASYYRRFPDLTDAEVRDLLASRSSSARLRGTPQR